MKKSIILLIVVSALALIGYACDSTSNGGVCAENGGVVAATANTRLYYPCNISGPTGATTMSSGFSGTLTAINWLSQRVAAEGYIVLAFTPTNITGMVSGWRDAHKNCISRLQALNSSHAVLRGKIDLSKLQTCGYSKGGGGSLWASAQLGSTLKTTVGLAPWQEQFTSVTLKSITAPTLIQAGSSDSLAVAPMTRSEYNALGNISKAYIQYTGLGHAAWAAASGSTAEKLTGSIVAWMRYYMDGDTSYKSAIADTSGTSAHIWVDLGPGTTSSSSSSSSSGGCN